MYGFRLPMVRWPVQTQDEVGALRLSARLFLTATDEMLEGRYLQLGKTTPDVEIPHGGA